MAEIKTLSSLERFPELDTIYQQTGRLQEKMVARFPGPWMLKEPSIALLGQNQGFIRILRRSLFVFTIPMPPFLQVLGRQ